MLTTNTDGSHTTALAFIDQNDVSGATAYGLHVDSENAAGPAVYIESANAVALKVDGPIVGKFQQIDKSADSVSLTAAECSDTLVTTRGWDGADDQTFTLPDADTSVGAGLKLKILIAVTDADNSFYIDTEGSTTNIYLDGTAVGDGERVWTEFTTVGESIVCHSATLDGTTYDWFCDSINGTWADKGS